MTVLVVERRFQGAEGLGQGGYLAGLMAAERDLFTVDFRRPIPLDAPLSLESTPSGNRVVHDGSTIAEGHRGPSVDTEPKPASFAEAEKARVVAERRPLERARHCFSCGAAPDSLRIHAGPTADGRSATPYEPPEWTTDRNGEVEAPYIWAPLDCASAWHVTERVVTAVTASLTVERIRPVRAGERLVVVATAESDWDGRKRRAHAALYTEQGELCARSTSLWVRPRV